MSIKTYEVAIANSFDAVSPEDAVMQMAEWLQEAAGHAGYAVTLYYENQDDVEYIDDDVRAPDTWFIDADNIDRAAVWAEVDEANGS